MTYVRLNIQSHTAAHAKLDRDDVPLTATNSTFVLFKNEGLTAPATTDRLILFLEGSTSADSAAFTACIDSITKVRAATVPTAWISSRNIFNNLDEDD